MSKEKNYTFQEYQEHSNENTEMFPIIGHKIVYPTLGLAGEAGEVAEKIKKIFRDKDGEFSIKDQEEIKSELGDILWYVAQICSILEITLEDTAVFNIKKLRSRYQRGKIQGSGDGR